jgi:hypothetical protein
MFANRGKVPMSVVLRSIVNTTSPWDESYRSIVANANIQFSIQTINKVMRGIPVDGTISARRDKELFRSANIDLQNLRRALIDKFQGLADDFERLHPNILVNQMIRVLLPSHTYISGIIPVNLKEDYSVSFDMTNHLHLHLYRFYNVL